MEAPSEPATDESNPKPRWWQWAHVLSLEAPIVAVAWQLGLAEMHGIQLLPAVVAALAVTVWWIYAADRTLDALRARSTDLLDVRHQFYHRHRKLWFGLLLPLGGGVIVWLALGFIPEGLLWQGLTLGLLALLYLAAYSARGLRWSHALLLTLAGFGALILIGNLPGGNDFKLTVSLIVIAVLVAVYLRQVHDERRTLLPKPLAAAIIFALGCVLAIRFFAPWETGVSLRLEELLLTCLFGANLTGIRVRETDDLSDTVKARRERSLHAGMVIFGAVLVTVSLAAVWSGLAWDRLNGLAMGVGAGLLVLEGLHRRRATFSQGAFRVLADLATLTPLPILFWS